MRAHNTLLGTVVAPCGKPRACDSGPVNADDILKCGDEGALVAREVVVGAQALGLHQARHDKRERTTMLASIAGGVVPARASHRMIATSLANGRLVGMQSPLYRKVCHLTCKTMADGFLSARGNAPYVVLVLNAVGPHPPLTQAIGA